MFTLALAGENVSSHFNLVYLLFFPLHHSAEHLNEARGNAFNPKSKELIDAQIKRNELAIVSNEKLKQIRMKEEQLEQQRKRQLLVNNNTENVCNFNGHKVHSDNVKYEIVRAMEQQDSLLEILIQKQPSTSLTKTSSAPVSPKSSFSSKTGTKLPVGDKTTIEELKLSNTQLKLLVNQLVDMLEEEKKQNEDLRNEIKCLKESLTSNDRDRDTKSLPIYLDDSLDTPKLLY